MYELARKVGSVFQNPKSQFFNLDTDSELAFGLENEGRTPDEIRKRVADTVDALHLQDLQGRSIFSLSGGPEAVACLRLRLRHGSGDFCAGRTHGQSGPGRHCPAP